MEMPQNQPNQRSFRISIYTILIVISLGGMIGRILRVESSSGTTPFLSANDVSRWSTIRALVDHQTYSIDRVMYAKDKSTRWSTIDKVYHVGSDGKRHFYSSKPPLLPTLLAGKYWLIKKTIGVSIDTHPFYVGRIILITTHGVLMLIYFALLCLIVERYATTDWGKVFVIASACFGTFITTFGVTLNNHLIGAVFCLFAVYCWLRIWMDKRTNLWYFFIAGFAAAFTAANELPALSLFGFLGLSLLWKHPKETLIAGVPGALVVLIAFFGTNYIAHDSWRPPYMHRGDGQSLATISMDSANELDDSNISEEITTAFKQLGIGLSNQVKIEVRQLGTRWVLEDKQLDRNWALQTVDNQIEIRQWDHWYDFRGTYWKDGQKQGIDKGEPSRLWYTFHMLLGHHGVFSLTPIWILTVVGLASYFSKSESDWKQFALLVISLSLICILFYIFRPLKDRNYGGVCCGFRWLFWFTPLWLIAMIPAADWCSKKKWSISVCTFFLAISAISASYGGLNPWTHPWIYTYLDYLGWISF